MTINAESEAQGGSCLEDEKAWK